jgi:cell division protein FtsW
LISGTDDGVRDFDMFLMIITVSLVFFGMIMVYSTTSVVAPGSPSSAGLIDLRYLKKHLMSLVLGFAAMWVFLNTRLDVMRRYAPLMFALAAVMLLAVFAPKIGVHAIKGARRWINLGFFTFQPSEFMKLAMVTGTAWYISSRWFDKDDFKSFLKPVFVMFLVQGVLLMQPDFGSAVLIGAITFMMLFTAGVKLRYLMSVGVLLVPVVIKLVKEPYRLSRILTFLNPWADEQGKGFQLVQSFVAFGSGGVQGVGIGKSSQKLFFLPEAKTDFIFSIVGEELGLIGVFAVCILFLLFFVRGIIITGRAGDRFSRASAVGITVSITLQAVLNMAVVTGLVPTKGLTLPFISLGGSSIIMNMAAVGLLLNISRGASSLADVAAVRPYEKRPCGRTARRVAV